jgi:hypothetical protein
MTERVLKLGPGDVAIGAVVCDWNARKLEFHGMTGEGVDWDIMPDDVVALVREAQEQGKEAWALMFWKDNDQLCAHDIAGFEGELYEEEPS